MGFFRSFLLFFISNKPIAWLFFVCTLFAGVFGFFSLPQQYNPEVNLPAFQIITEYPGATAEEVKMFVTERIEEKIKEIPEIEELSSFSFDGGVSLLNVQFSVQKDLESAKIELFSKIQENMDLSPDTRIPEPRIKTMTPDDTAMGVWMFTSATLSQGGVRERVLSLASQVRKAEGVANVLVTGGQTRALQIRIDPEKLKENNLDLLEVVKVLRENNGRLWAGNLEYDGKELHSVVVDTRVHNANTASNIVITSGKVLGDIATITEGYAHKDSFVLGKNDDSVRNKEAVFLSVSKRKGENTQEVISAVQKVLQEELSLSQWQEIQMQEIKNQAQTAQNEIRGLGVNLLQSLGIVFVILLLFLGVRPAFLVGIAIPLSLLMVFFWGAFFDHTINRITLFALILSLGLMVDSATVVVENIYRHLRMAPAGISSSEKIQRITLAVQEVGMGLFISTITSVLVFLPLTQISGMMGPYMGPLAFFVPMALLSSLVVAYTFMPFFASLLLSSSYSSSNSTEHIKLSTGVISSALPPQKFHFFEWITNIYEKILRFLFKHAVWRKGVLYGAFGMLFCSFLLIPFQGVQFQMLPKSDSDTLWITIDLQEGSAVEQTHDTVVFAVDALEELEEIESVLVFTGEKPILDFNGLFRGFASRSEPHQSSVFVSFDSDRSRSAQDLVSHIRRILEPIALQNNATVRVIENPPGPPVSSVFVAKVFSENGDAQQKVSEFLQKQMYITPGITDIDASDPHSYPQSVFILDFEKAKEYGVSAKHVSEVIQFSISPQEITSYFGDDMPEKGIIELQILPEKRDTIEDFEKIMVRSSGGELVPLSAFVHVASEYTQPFIWRDAQRTGVFVNAEMENRGVIYATVDVLFALFDTYEVESFSLYGITVREPHTGENVRIEWGGEFEMTLDNFRDLLLAMAVAFFLVYGVLVAQFRSFAVPALLMATVPLALLGILAGFSVLEMFWGIPLTATALIGFIALLGIVVNNAIIYLECFTQLQSQGKEIQESLIEAGKIRLRPILLTSCTTVLGSLTIAFDPVWSGLAWSIVFGLSFSALLTVVIFPLLYLQWKS